MQAISRFPGNASVYEVMRTRPGARASLNAAGLTDEFLDYRIGDAARAIGVPIERINELIEREPVLSAQ